MLVQGRARGMQAGEQRNLGIGRYSVDSQYGQPTTRATFWTPRNEKITWIVIEYAVWAVAVLALVRRGCRGRGGVEDGGGRIVVV